MEINRDAKATDIEDAGGELQEAIDEMNRLDTILAALQVKEQQLKLQGKEMKKQLWGELMSTPKIFEYPGEAGNTRLFLALEAPHESNVEADFEPVFGTQPPDESETDIGHEEQSKKNMTHLTNSREEGQEEKGQESPRLSHSDAPLQGKMKQDFVKKNIELAGAAGGLVLMTQAEKERLAELLREIDEEDEQEEDHAVGGLGDYEGDAWVLSVPTGHGYTPEPAQLEQLRYIDSMLNLLSPVEDFFSVRSSFVNCSMSQVFAEGLGSDAGWELGGEAWASRGGGVGCVSRLTSPRDAAAAEDAGLVVSREMTSLSEEQLRGLLDECELTESSHPQRPISEALLAALLRDPYTTSLTHLGPATLDN